jgi:hypothetical protein
MLFVVTTTHSLVCIDALSVEVVDGGVFTENVDVGRYDAVCGSEKR